MIFDDGKHRVELRYFGVGHTHGDGFAWLPKEKILFTGDACVNGPYNYMGDGDSGAWIETLAKAQTLGATVVAPGHGPAGDARRARGPAAVFRRAPSRGAEAEGACAGPCSGGCPRHA